MSSFPLAVLMGAAASLLPPAAIGPCRGREHRVTRLHSYLQASELLRKRFLDAARSSRLWQLGTLYFSDVLPHREKSWLCAAPRDSLQRGLDRRSWEAGIRTHPAPHSKTTVKKIPHEQNEMIKGLFSPVFYSPISEGGSAHPP